MAATTRQSRIIAGLLVLVAIGLTAVWISGADPEGATLRDAAPPETLTAKPMAVPESMEVPAPRPADAPRELSAPSVDSSESAAEDADDSTWVYELRHASGAAASGLRVAFQRGGRTVHVGESDAQGRVDFADRNPAAGPPTGLWIGGVSGLILGAPTPERATEDVFRVDLPAGNELVGTVTVDGLVPTRPVDLALDRFGSKKYELPPDEGVRQRLIRTDSRMSSSREHEAANAQRATADGRFRFSGLQDDWRGRLHFPSDLHVDPELHAEQHTPSGTRNPDGMEGLGSFDLELPGAQPTTQLRLALRTRPILRGRAVLPNGSSAAGATVTYEFVEAQYPQAFSSDPTAPDGRFAIPCTWGAGRTPRLTLLAADGSGMATIEVPSAHRTHGVDLGDVELRRTRAVDFRALDVAGEPIVGGIATPADGSTMKSARTDADGLSRIVLALDTPQFTVHALEYESAEVLVPEDLPDVLDVVLEDCCVLRLRLADDSGADPSALMWKVSVSAPPFTRSEEIQPEPVRLELGLSSARMSNYQTMGVSPGHQPGDRGIGAATVMSGSLSYAVDADELVLSCLRPNALMDVSLTDLGGLQVIWEEPSLSLAPGEDRLVVAHVETHARQFTGRVTDAHGSPIEGARIYAGPTRVGAPAGGGGWMTAGTDTDADGRFSVDGLLCDAVDYDIAKTGYLTVEQTNVSITSGAEVQITMRPSRSVDVEITSAARLERGAMLHVIVQDGTVFSSGLRQTVEGGVPTRPHGYSVTAEAAAGEAATLRLVDGDRSWERISPPDERTVFWELPEDD